MNPRETILVRPYRAGDEADVRRICFETALYGESMAPLLDDVQLVSEALIGPYIRITPEQLFVARVGQAVAGYLSGCFNAERIESYYRRGMAIRLLKLFMERGHWRRSRSWRFAWRGSVHAARIRRLVAPVRTAYPAHLHINLDARYRRQHLGSLLLRRFEEAAREAAVPGVYATTATDPGRSFFARHGFELLAQTDVPSIVNGAGVVVMLLGKQCPFAVHPHSSTEELSHLLAQERAGHN